MKYRNVLFASLALFSQSVLGQGILDQAFVPTAPNLYADNFGGISLGQTFTVGISGILTEVDVFIPTNAAQTVSWSLTKFGSGDVLATGFVTPTDATTAYSMQPCFMPVGLVHVNAGDVLAITLSSPSLLQWAGNDLNPYSRGAYIYDSQSDLGFQNFVQAVPEPSSMLLLLTGVGIFVLNRPRRVHL